MSDQGCDPKEISVEDSRFNSVITNNANVSANLYQAVKNLGIKVDKILGQEPADSAKSERAVEPEAWIDKIIQQQRGIEDLSVRILGIIERI